MKRPDGERMGMVRMGVGRRTFLKAAGVAAGAAATSGLAGILEAGRAPAFAQGTKLHVLRWTDFIPEADAELKRQAPLASKALGAEVTIEFINVNDLQARTTSAIESKFGADIIQLLWNWPHLYASALVDVSDVAEPIGKAQGATTTSSTPPRRSEASGWPSRTGSSETP